MTGEGEEKRGNGEVRDFLTNECNGAGSWGEREGWTAGLRERKRENRNETYTRLLFYVNDSFLGFMTRTLQAFFLVGF